jgi:hypothetical protein
MKGADRGIGLLFAGQPYERTAFTAAVGLRHQKHLFHAAKSIESLANGSLVRREWDLPHEQLHRHSRVVTLRPS